MIHLAAGDHQSIMFQLISFVLFLIIIIFHALLLTPTSARCYFGGETCLNNGFEIQYPFWSSQRSVTENSSEVYYPCGYSGFEINCGIETARKAVMNISDHLYYVLENIDYYSKWLRVMDKDVDRQNCPRPKRNISLESNPMLSYDKQYLFYNCSSYPIAKSRYDFLQVQDIPCLNNNSNLTDDKYSYAVYDYGYDDSVLSWFKENCQETVVIPVFTGNYSESARFGFNFSWSVPDECDKCERSGGNCYYNKTAEVYQCDCSTWRTDGPTSYDPLICRHDQHGGLPTGLKAIIGVSTGVVGLLLILLLIYRKTFYALGYSAISRWKKKIKKPTNVEEFLEGYGVALHRYNYSEIKKMTNSFKDTLGQGGYGSVFQGKLNRDGVLVAVKLLNESKGNGEDFINEVATIGRTNHVNVVSLLGFCTEGTKRALVYEFMPNGSLERFIYNDKMSSPNATTLGWDKLYQIALGIARGLEYLHCRCNTRIVHFDIKPHNILLDQDFCPKISDFGLAKLCPTKESIVSMVGTRGTMGYIAPEIACRNLGGVSHKSDVYSYGMMVLEMIGGRKNLDVTVENMSGIYFPHWIYNQLKQDSKVGGPEVMKFEGAGAILKDATAKKMIIVALWCIQTHPANRPSMTKVVEMLEGSDEVLQMPPNPSTDHVSLSSSSST